MNRYIPSTALLAWLVLAMTAPAQPGQNNAERRRGLLSARHAFHEALAAATSPADLAQAVHAAIGPSELMEFARFDAGEVLRKGGDGRGPEILRFIVGNPLIMREMAETVPDAASYAPVTILVDERADGVHLSYDSMASLLSPYGSEAALAVARDLDAKIHSLLETAAR